MAGSLLEAKGRGSSSVVGRLLYLEVSFNIVNDRTGRVSVKTDSKGALRSNRRATTFANE